MTIQNKNILRIGLGLLLLILSNIMGHFFATFSIMITPVLLTLIIGGLNASFYKQNFRLTLIYNFGLLLFNDFLIRLFASGTHDQEGKDWVFVFFAMAFILASITMLVYAITIEDKPDHPSKIKSMLLNIFTLLVLTTLTAIFYWYILANI
ncbi:MAG: hypothetical protein K0R51_2455 [Cytophagaceae bacterium]|jgi:hypothetical protein|nr:hypothetical protein [Cytophagaceae bacterium]